MVPPSHSIHNITVIGAGAWGTALARLLAGQGLAVRLWAYEPEVVEAIRSTGENTSYLPGISLPASIYVTNTLEESVHQMDVMVLAVPSHAMRASLEQLQAFLTKPLPLIIATKGIEEDSLCLMSEVVESVLASSWHPFVTVLSGPSFALEVSRNKPTTILLAGENSELVSCLQRVLLTPSFRVYTGHDPVGAQIGGSLKNVLAIASGIVDGLDLGFNARAALITRGLAEMIRLGAAMGAATSTLYGLSGLGDLVLTCTGSLSRNYTVGLNLGQGKTLTHILKETKTIAEGIRTTRAVVGLANRYHVEMPIVRSVSDVLFHGHNPGQLVANLMTRTAKRETEGNPL